MEASMGTGYNEHFGSTETFGDLLKALQASGQGGTDGTPIVPEDLEIEAYTTLWRQEHLKLLKMLPIVPGRAITHEFTRITGYTGTDTEGFLRDGGTPNAFDFTSQRATEQIRPIGERFSVTGMMGAVRNIQAMGQTDVVAIQRTTKLLGLQQKMIRAIYSADTLGLGTGATPKFRGMEQIIKDDADAQNVIDLAGKTLVQDTFDEAAEIITLAFGELTHVNMSPDALRNYTKTIQNMRQVIGIPERQGGAGFAGLRINAVRHSFGESELVGDIFLAPKYSKYKTAPKYNTTTNPKPDNAPVQPTDANLATSVAVDSASKFTATDVSEYGTYYYAVTYDNAHDIAKDKTGEGDARINGDATPTGQAVAAGERVDVLVSNPPTGVTSARIYRAVKSSTDLADYQFIGELSTPSADGALDFTFKDLNEVISHTKDSAGVTKPTTVGFGLTLPTHREVVTRGQGQMAMQYPVDVPDAVKRIDLAPIFPRPQAILGDLIADELLLWYGAVEIPTPNRIVFLKNIGIRNI